MVWPSPDIIPPLLLGLAEREALLLLELTTLPRLLLERGARLADGRGLVRVDIPPVDAAVRFTGSHTGFSTPTAVTRPVMGLW